MGIVHELSVTGRALLAARRRRRASAPEPDLDRFEREIANALALAPEGLVRDLEIVRVPADRPPWHPTSLVLEKGDRVSAFAAGRVYVSKLFDVWVAPHFQLWLRVGETGPAFRGTRDTHSFVAESAGRLELASYFPGEWKDPAGHLATPPEEYRRASGGMAVALVRWAAEPERALEALLAAGAEHPLLRAELDRLHEPPASPEGWRYLWFLGPAEIYRAAPDDAGEAIACRTHQDVGILQREASFDFRPGTRLRWSWRVDALPSELPEDTLLTHDYLSIAVEFENGQDLTYYWSATLPEGTGYRCPLPTWKARETHVVVRSGPRRLGTWLDEDRDLYADYRRFVGEPPERIVRVWLIANSLFQRGEGRCAYRRIRLARNGVERRVL